MKKGFVTFLIVLLIFTNGCALLFGQSRENADRSADQLADRRAPGGVTTEGSAPRMTRESQQTISDIDPYGFHEKKIQSYENLPAGLSGSADDIGSGFRLFKGSIPPEENLVFLLSEEDVQQGTAFALFDEEKPIMQGYAYKLSGEATTEAEKHFADILDDSYGTRKSLEDRTNLSPAEQMEYASTSNYYYWMDGAMRIELMRYPSESETTLCLAFTDTGQMDSMESAASKPESVTPGTTAPSPTPYAISIDEVNDETFSVSLEEVLTLPGATTASYDETTVYSAPARIMRQEGMINIFAAESVYCTQYIASFEDMQRTNDDDLALFNALRNEVKRYFGREYDKVVKDFEQEASISDVVGLFYSTQTGVSYELIWQSDEISDISVGVEVDEDGSGSIWLAYNSYL